MDVALKNTVPRHGLLMTALAPVLPQIAGSWFNIWYNREIVEPLLGTQELAARFLRTIVFYNVLIYPLDVRTQAHILKLVARLRSEHGLSYLLITHNFGVVSELCEQTAVLYLGNIAEIGDTKVLLRAAAHPYTVALRSAVPEVDITGRRSRIVLPGDPPDAANPPSGCVFHPRCPLAVARCRTEVPILRDAGPRHQVACHRA